MTAKQANVLQGTLDLLVLKALGPGELHGLGISRRIEQITRGTFQVKPGSLFPALHRMEEAGWLTRSGARAKPTGARSSTGCPGRGSASLKWKPINGRQWLLP